jgi:DNA-binding CsgD family transcriptional regulator/tetratricopeptide (TPR) repeat protein
MGAMVGRDQELAAVVGSLTADEVALTLVMGEAGIGKSRLVAEAVAATPERLTLAGGCLPMRHALPLLPIVDALDTGDPTARQALARAARSLPGALRPHVAGVMPRNLPEEIEPAEEVRRDQLFIATEALLSRIAHERPVTLVVEDVHWADPDTLDLVTYLARARHDTGLHMLVTCRSDETQMSEQVSGWLDTLPGSAGVYELHLEPLDSDDVRRLVAALPHADGVDLDRLAAGVFARAAGNPFFTEQLVASGADGERLPGRLAKLLSARVRSVSLSAQEAITALAVLARPVPLAALRVVTLHEEEACLSAVKELESASLVARDERGLRLRHALLAEALLAEVPGLPAAYHRRVADALRSLDDPTTVAEIADHLQRAGDEPAELKTAQLAAQRAWDLGGYADAARWYQRVLDIHARHPEEPLLLAEPVVVRRIIRALDLSGAPRAADSLAERALRDYAEWPHLGDRLGLLSQCAKRLTSLDPEQGQRLIEDLLPLYEKLPPRGDHAELLTRLAFERMERGDSRQAVGYTEKAIEVARAAHDLEQHATALARLSLFHWYLGDRRAADTCAREATQLAERSADDSTLLFTLIIESANRIMYAEYEVVVTIGERGRELAERSGLRNSPRANVMVRHLGEALLALGRTDELGRLIDVLTDQPLRPDDDVLYPLRAHADLRRGHPDRALTWLRREGAIQGTHDTAALAYALLWSDQPAEALEVVSSSLPGAAVGAPSQMTGPLFSLGARAAADLSENGDGSGGEAIAVLDELREAMALDPFADRETLPRASVDRRQWLAERTRAQGRSDPDAWIDAASGWEALSMPHDAAYCWWRAAEALLATGANKPEVRAALHAAHRFSDGHVPLRDEVGKVATRARIPILDALDTDATPGDQHLTAQETKVLRLLATGLTNAEIGTALFISPKTASVHVSNLLRKLGVSNRTEAAAWANRHGLVPDP